MSDVLIIAIVCLFSAVAVFGLAAMLDAPHRERWRMLAARIALRATTFGSMGLRGESHGHYVTVEPLTGPDPQNLMDDEARTAWTCLTMTVNNVSQRVCLFAKSSSVDLSFDWLPGRFHGLEWADYNAGQASARFLVNGTSARLIPLLLADSATERALADLHPPFFIMLYDWRLTCTELGAGLLNTDDIAKCAGRLELAIALLSEIAKYVELQPDSW